MSVFYDHIADLQGLDEQLKQYLPNDAERAHVLSIFDASLHTLVLDVIFEAIPVTAHEVFLVQFRQNPAAEEHLPFLRQHHPDIDRLLAEAVTESRKQFIDAIHAA